MRRLSSALTPVENLFINTGWGTGGFKATPGSGWVMAYTMAHGIPHELNRPLRARSLCNRTSYRRTWGGRGRALKSGRRSVVGMLVRNSVEFCDASGQRNCEIGQRKF